MNLEEYDFPEVRTVDFAFPTFDTEKDLLEEAKSRDLTKGKAKFNELFFKGGEFDFQDDIEGTWKEKAFRYAKCLMGSFAPRHEHKEAVCAMIFEETLKL